MYLCVCVQVYAAHAVSYRQAVLQALEEGHEWAAFFEDDIILTAPPAVVSRYIQRALAQVPMTCVCVCVCVCVSHDFTDDFHIHRCPQTRTQFTWSTVSRRAMTPSFTLS
jgi:hypothetical protein